MFVGVFGMCNLMILWGCGLIGSLCNVVGLLSRVVGVGGIRCVLWICFLSIVVLNLLNLWLIGSVFSVGVGVVILVIVSVIGFNGVGVGVGGVLMRGFRFLKVVFWSNVFRQDCKVSCEWVVVVVFMWVFCDRGL